MSQQQAPYTTPGSRYYALGVLTVVYSFNFIDRQLLAILQESIKADLSLSDSQLGLLTGFAFAVFYVVAGIPIARWADRSNRRNIVALAVFIWSFMTAISGFVQNYLQLLLARIGVGLGEAGGSPPSHSMISDMFPPQRRAFAISVYSTGVSLGILFGFLFGGWLNEFFGWRVAFLVVGVPGILLAIVVRYTMAEPVRGSSEGREAGDTPGFKEVMNLLFIRKSFRYIALGAAFNAFCGYTLANWSASFMIRSYQMPTGELGSWLALIIGVGGAFGIVCGGALSDHMGRLDKRWYVWIPAIGSFVMVPALIGQFTAQTASASLLIMAIPGTLMNVYLGASIAITHSLVGLRMRSTASAILFLILNIIGLGCGPWTVGLLSDYLTPQFGDEALRHAMLYVTPVAMTVSGLLFLRAAKYLREDLAKAPE